MRSTTTNPKDPGLLPHERFWGDIIRDLPLEGCPPSEVLIEIAARGRHAANYNEHMSHIALCPSCFRLFEEARALVAVPVTRAQRDERPYLHAFSGGLVGAGVCAALCFLYLRPQQTLINEQARIIAAQTAIITQQEGNTRQAVGSEGELRARVTTLEREIKEKNVRAEVERAETTRLVTQAQQDVDEVRRISRKQTTLFARLRETAQRDPTVYAPVAPPPPTPQSRNAALIAEIEAGLKVPKWIAGLPMVASVARGAGETPGQVPAFLGLSRGFQTRFATRTPVLAWKAVHGTTYRLFLRASQTDDPCGGVPQDGLVLKTNHYSVRVPLEYGTAYSWEVRAEGAGGKIQAASDSAAFEVITRDEALQIANETRRYARDPLALATMYYRAGLLDDALEKCRAAQRMGDARNRAAGRRLEGVARACRTDRAMAAPTPTYRPPLGENYLPPPSSSPEKGQ